MKSCVLKEKEKLFCYYYTSSRDLKQAALKAGYKLFPEKIGAKLLQRPDIKGEIKKLDQEIASAKLNVKTGYERLAFGSISDAVKMLFSENIQDCDFDLMDFFNISDIKKLKDGAMEIKFFDRFKALEKLSEIYEKENSKTPPLYEAIIESAKALSGGEDLVL